MLYSYWLRVARFLNFSKRTGAKRGSDAGKSKKNTQDSEPIGDGKNCSNIISQDQEYGYFIYDTNGKLTGIGMKRPSQEKVMPETKDYFDYSEFFEEASVKGMQFSSPLIGIRYELNGEQKVFMTTSTGLLSALTYVESAFFKSPLES